MSESPVLTEVWRGGRVESRHRVAVVVADAAGRRLLSFGDVGRPVYPRSAVKIVQALPLVESGAADALGFGTAELAISGASHNGEPRHVETARAMLAAVGRGENDLVCGAQPPNRMKDQAALVLEGLKPGRLHNNCSGKHAGFVCFACHLGLDPAGYGAAAHPVQRILRAALSDVFACDLVEDDHGVDGCSIPTWAIPVEKLATGMARLATGQGLAPERAAAARRIMQAAMADPFMVAGTNRFCTGFMAAYAGAVYAKTGAEGVFCAALPDQGLGIALKCEDGAARAAEAVLARIVAELTGRTADPALEPFLRPVLKNWNDEIVGHIATVDALEHGNWTVT